MLARDLLDAVGPALAPVREIRYLDRETSFDGIDDDDLRRAAQSLRALSYSCQQGATTLEAVLNRRSYLRRAAEAET